MKTRIKAIRKALKLSQDEFASALGYTRGKITNIESGKVIPSPDDPFIALLCRTWNINPDYVKTGTGDMFLPTSRKQAIADFMADCLKDEEDSFRVGLIEALAALSVDEWEFLEKIATSAAKRNIEKKNAEIQNTQVADAEDAYIKSRSNSASNTDSSASSIIDDTEKKNKNVG